MNIKILGTGCSRCRSLEKYVLQAVNEMQLNATVEKEEDIIKIMEYGIMRTPGLVIDEKVILAGQLPTVKELKELIQNNLNH